jgi:hypothetical protein
MGSSINRTEENKIEIYKILVLIKEKHPVLDLGKYTGHSDWTSLDNEPNKNIEPPYTVYLSNGRITIFRDFAKKIASGIELTAEDLAKMAQTFVPPVH